MDTSLKYAFITALVFCTIIIGLALFNQPKIAHPELIKVKAGSFLYRLSGEFNKKDSLVDAPVVRKTFPHPFYIMKYQVSATDYEACVRDKACERPFKTPVYRANFPITGVSFKDAQDYASWLSKFTGIVWRLPTDVEWSHAAGSRFVDDAVGLTTDGSDDPSKRWLLKYRKFGSKVDFVVRKQGAYGANENGIYDLSGNVWEWTSSCFTRSNIADATGTATDIFENCGVRIAEGQHRAYIPFFVKDAKGGGCAVGIPPRHLGIRLVTDRPLILNDNKLQS